MPTEVKGTHKIDINRKVGPLPLWGYGAVALGGYFIYKRFIQPANAANAADATGSVSGGGYGINNAPADGGGGGGGGATGPPLPVVKKKPPHRKPGGGGGKPTRGGGTTATAPPRPPVNTHQGGSRTNSRARVATLALGSAGGGGVGLASGSKATQKARKQYFSHKLTTGGPGGGPIVPSTHTQKPPPSAKKYYTTKLTGSTPAPRSTNSTRRPGPTHRPHIAKAANPYLQHRLSG